MSSRTRTASASGSSAKRRSKSHPQERALLGSAARRSRITRKRLSSRSTSATMAMRSSRHPGRSSRELEAARPLPIRGDSGLLGDRAIVRSHGARTCGTSAANYGFTERVSSTVDETRALPPGLAPPASFGFKSVEGRRRRVLSTACSGARAWPRVRVGSRADRVVRTRRGRARRV